MPVINVLACLCPSVFYARNIFGTLFEIERVVKIIRKQIIQTCGKEGDETVETKFTTKRERFLSNVGGALKQMPAISTEESAEMESVILQDMIRLENSASSGSVSLSGDSDSGEGYIVLENPMTFAHYLN